jgi:hypothetical protein
MKSALHAWPSDHIGSHGKLSARREWGMNASAGWMVSCACAKVPWGSVKYCIEVHVNSTDSFRCGTRMLLLAVLCVREAGMLVST